MRLLRVREISVALADKRDIVVFHFHKFFYGIYTNSRVFFAMNIYVLITMISLFFSK